MRFPCTILAVVCILVSPFQLMAQSAEAQLLASDRAASSSSSDSGLPATLTRSFDRNGVLLWPGAPVVVGLEQARRLVSMIAGQDTLRLTWQPLGTELSGDSALGLTWGIAILSSRLTPAPPHLGRYTATWRLDAGRWTISALLFMGVKPAITTVPQGLPLTRPPAPATGRAGPFVAADLAFARLAGDSGAVVAFRTWAAPDAIVSGGSGMLVRGPDAIANGVAGPAVWRWHPVAAGASPSGDLGWTVGEAIIAPEKGDTSFSKYLTVWRRPPGQPIRFLTDGGNARTPATGSR